MARKIAVSLVILALFFVRIGHAFPFGDPLEYFNVYSLGNIGSSTNPYTSDFQGVAGAYGSAYFEHFGLHDVPPPTEFSLYTGGDAWLRHGSFLNGGIEAYGSVFLDYFYIEGDVVAGGDVSDILQGGGTITGDVTAAGSVDLSEHVSVVGTKTSGVPFSPTVDHDEVADYFLRRSDEIGAMPDTTTYTDDGYGKLTIFVDPGVNVVTIDAATFAYAWGIHVIGPAGAKLYVNVPDDTAAFDSVVWWTDGGVRLQDILVNFPAATSVEFTGLHAVDMLMPRADTYFHQGLVIGTLVTRDLFGDGQVNVPPLIPEPATLLLFGAALVCTAVCRRRRAA